jgi:hypothetical protein
VTGSITVLQRDETDQRKIVFAINQQAGWINANGIPGIGSAITEAPSDGHLYGRVNATWASGGTFNASVSVNGNLNATGIVAAGPVLVGALPGDLSTNRGSGAGAVYFGGSTSVYIIYNGSNWVFNGGGTATFTSSITCNGRIAAGPAISGSAGDLSCNRNNGTAYCWFASASQYLGFDGANWQMIGGSNFNYTGGLVISLGSTIGSLIHSGVTITGGYGLTYNNWGGANNQIGFSWNNVVAGQVTVSIDGPAATLTFGTSDARLKADIAPTQLDCLACIEKLTVRQFRWKDHTIPGEPAYDPKAPLQEAGLIAQEVHQVAPFLVHQGDKFGQLRTKGELERDGAGSKTDMGNVMWGISTNNMLATLIGAVQQLNQKIEDLEQRVRQLELAQGPQQQPA